MTEPDARTPLSGSPERGASEVTREPVGSSRVRFDGHPPTVIVPVQSPSEPLSVNS